MRKILIVCGIVVSLPIVLFLLNVSATSPLSAIWTVRLSAPYGLRAGDGVEEAGRRIGSVVGVEPRGSDGADIYITLDPDSRDRLRERSTFLVMTPAGSTRPILNLVVFDEHSPVLPPGSALTGTESETELELKRQLTAMEGAVHVLTRQLEDLRSTVEKTRKSEEKKRLEESVGGLFDTVRRTGDDLEHAVTQELDRWKKTYDKLLPPPGREKPARFAS